MLSETNTTILHSFGKYYSIFVPHVERDTNTVTSRLRSLQMAANESKQMDFLSVNHFYDRKNAISWVIYVICYTNSI